MRGSVGRSQSLRAENTGDSPNSLRPKVSFNRAVHIKRISRKERVLEEEEEGSGAEVNGKMPANGIKPSGKFSTLPSRAAHSNGVSAAPSERLSRLIRTDPKPEDGPRDRSQEKKPPTLKKKTLGERVRGIFSKRKAEEQDELKTRYTEFKGKNSSSDATDNEVEQYQGKRRGSAPETRTSWFRSLERVKKTDGGRKERYFGESDRDSSSQRRSRMNDSSADSATEQEGMGSRAPSLVYLHTAAVGDIPQRRSETPSRRLSRSVSVLAPWAPKSRPPRAKPQKGWPPKATRSRATQTESPKLMPRASPVPESRSLPKLVFTGPSIEERMTSGRSTTSTIQRSTVHMRSRK